VQDEEDQTRLIRPSLILGEMVAGRCHKISLISSCSPRKMACVVDSIGTLVVDICVVALQKDLSQEDTREIDVQLSSDSLYL
jgi:hypothetical protein